MQYLKGDYIYIYNLQNYVLVCYGLYRYYRVTSYTCSLKWRSITINTNAKHVCYNLPRRVVQLAPYRGKL